LILNIGIVILSPRSTVVSQIDYLLLRHQTSNIFIQYFCQLCLSFSVAI